MNSNHSKKLILITIASFILSACESVYYDAMEKVGVHKREIMIDRIEAAQEAQEEGQQQFKDALEQFQTVLNFDGGDLEDVYKQLNSEYEDSVAAAENITTKIDSVASVSDALFSEWEGELAEYTSANLRRDSERQLKETRRQYERLMRAMRRAERTIDPVLSSLKDNVRYLKHNLNARAIASLKGELGNVNDDVERLIAAMQSAINESNSFVNQLREG